MQSNNDNELAVVHDESLKTENSSNDESPRDTAIHDRDVAVNQGGNEPEKKGLHAESMLRKARHHIRSGPAWLANNLSSKVLSIVVMILVVIIVILLVKLQLANLLSNEVKVTNVAVHRQLEAVNELVTERYSYTGMSSIENTRKLFDVDIPLTTHTIHVLYVGTIKVGFDLNEIRVNVDSEKKIINVWMPEPIVLDNYIDVESIKCIYNNSLFNPIDENEVNTYLSEVKTQQLESAKKDEIFKRATDDAKSLLITYLEIINEEYTVSIR